MFGVPPLGGSNFMPSESVNWSLHNLDECRDEVVGAQKEISADFAGLSNLNYVPEALFMGPLWHLCTAWHCLVVKTLPESIYDAFAHKVPKLTSELMLVDLLHLARHTTKNRLHLPTMLAQLEQCRHNIEHACQVIEAPSPLTVDKRIALFHNMLRPLIKAWHVEREYDLPTPTEHLLPNWDGHFELVPIAP
jgi:hypothetical protein